MTEDDLKSEGSKLFEFSLSEWFINSPPNKTNTFNDNGTVKSGVTISFTDDASKTSTEAVPILKSNPVSSVEVLNTLTQESTQQLDTAFAGLSASQISQLIKSITEEKGNPTGKLFAKPDESKTTSE